MTSTLCANTTLPAGARAARVIERWAFRGREVGIDVMGDGALIPFTGVVAEAAGSSRRDGEYGLRRGSLAALE